MGFSHTTLHTELHFLSVTPRGDIGPPPARHTLPQTPGFAKYYSLKRWREAEVLWGHLGVAVFILYFYWWAFRRWNEWKQHAARTVMRFGGTDSVILTQCSQLFDAWSVINILLENNNILDWNTAMHNCRLLLICRKITLACAKESTPYFTCAANTKLIHD